jgi:hypothetical protein
MFRFTEGQYALGALTVFAVWVFMVLPFLYEVPIAKKNHNDHPQASATHTNIPDNLAQSPIASVEKEATKPTSNSHQETRAEKESSEFWSAKLTDWLLVAVTIALVWFTRELVRSTNRLWEAGERQLRLVRDQFLSTHRPRIRAKAVWLINQSINLTEPLVIRVNYVNYGQTDAAVVTYGISVIVVRRGNPLPPDFQIPNTPGGFSFSRGITLRLPDFSHSISEEEAVGINRNLADLFCLGYIHYWDGLGGSAITHFCRRLEIDRVGGHGHFVRTGHPDYEYED